MGFNIPGVAATNNSQNLNSQPNNQSQNNNNQEPSNNTNNNIPAEQGPIDWKFFLSSLAPDLREDILLNIPPEQVSEIPQEYIEEYNQIIERHYGDTHNNHNISHMHSPQ